MVAKASKPERSVGQISKFQKINRKYPGIYISLNPQPQIAALLRTKDM